MTDPHRRCEEVILLLEKPLPRKEAEELFKDIPYATNLVEDG